MLSYIPYAMASRRNAYNHNEGKLYRLFLSYFSVYDFCEFLNVNMSGFCIAILLISILLFIFDVQITTILHPVVLR